MSDTNGDVGSHKYSLSEARLAMASGIKFGEIYPNLANPDDGEELKRIFVYGNAVMPAPKITLAYTGNFCINCGSGNMIRTGSCETCQDCGTAGSCG